MAPPGSFNNELGHPYTVLQADARRPASWCWRWAPAGRATSATCATIAPPRDRRGAQRRAWRTSASSARSRPSPQAKGELVEALPADGVAVLNADDPRVGAMAGADRGAGWCWSARRPTPTCGPRTSTLDERGRASYTLVTAGRARRRSRWRVTGRHQVGNTLAAAAVALAAGHAVRPRWRPALAELRLVSTRRMDVFDRADGVTVIDDSYNANPASMAAALHALAAIGRGRRRIAVLGYMAELGDYETGRAREVGRLAAELGVDRLIVVGEPARADPRRRDGGGAIGEESRCW